MIVTCPACSSRYRIREDKISGRGARITCPSCQHKFVVHKEQQPMVVGGEARGVPVTFARGGQTLRKDFPDEDDESDVPTTVMPHGSQLAQSIRAAAEAARAREAQIAASAAPSARRSGATPGTSGEDVSVPEDQAGEEATGGSGLVVVLGSLIVLVLVFAALVWTGIISLDIMSLLNRL